MEKETENRYSYWLNELKTLNEQDYELLKNISDKNLLNDMFYKELGFGTGGLRGVMGLGTNRMNVYTVAKVSFGLSKYVINHYKEPSIAIGYDSRNNSILFSKIAAQCFASLGIKVHIYSELQPTPCLSYAVRELKTSAGIIITASHNPSKYNGYKVYNELGCQITLDAANEMIGYINKVDEFKMMENLKSFNYYMSQDLIEVIDEKIIDQFIEDTLKISTTHDFRKKDVKIVYTPLNGAGLKPVTKTLKKAGFNNIIVPKEQELPDGNFPTCPYPNPEILEAMQVGINLCKKENADLLIATDPDCDRCGIGIKYNGDFRLLSGNEVAILLLDYIIHNSKLPKNPVVVRSIVSTSAVDKICEINGIELRQVLTGFKFIGEQICKLENDNEENRYIFGFEESYGYLTNTKVRDKDAVNASLIIAEMFNFYRNKNINLIDKLNSIYEVIGNYVDKLSTFEFDGEKGMKKMLGIMNYFRDSSFEQISDLFKEKLISKTDYLNSVKITITGKEKVNLPSSNVLELIFEGGIRLLARPSGTEPKIKVYYEISKNTLEESNQVFIEKLNIVNEFFSKQ